MDNEVIIREQYKIWLREDGIFQYDLIPKADIKLADVKDLFHVRREIFKASASEIIADIRNIRTIDVDARRYYSSPEAREMTSIAAIIVESTASKLIANFSFGLNKPPFPTKAFNDVEEAANWIKSKRK